MKHNTQLHLAAKPYSDTSVGNSTIGSKGQHRRATAFAQELEQRRQFFAPLGASGRCSGSELFDANAPVLPGFSFGATLRFLCLPK
jgi:hypothetical protein